MSSTLQIQKYRHNGDGLFKVILEKMPKPIKQWLIVNGNQRVMDIQVCRKPLGGIRHAMNILSFGKFKRNQKKLNFDDIYHLYMLVTLRDGSKWLVEKNQRVMLYDLETHKRSSKGGASNEGLECKPVNVSMVTMNQMFIKAERDNKGHFWQYSGEQYNCQNFISNMLRSSGMLTPELQTFINQDTLNLVPKGVAKIGKTLTNIAGTADWLIRGGEYQYISEHKSNVPEGW